LLAHPGLIQQQICSCVICFDVGVDTTFTHGATGNRACCGGCASRIFAAEQPCPVCRHCIDRLKKPRTETASFDAYYFRNLPKIHVDAARVPVHNGMHAVHISLRSVSGRSVSQSSMHACSAYEPMKTCMCATTKMDRCMQPSIGTCISISYMSEGKLAVMKANSPS